VYKRILVPDDGSPFAEQVLPHAIDIAQKFGAEIHLLEVIEEINPALYASTDMDAGMGAEITTEALQEAQEEMRVTGRERLSAIADRLRAEGVQAVWSIVDGDPAHAIIEYERTHDIDLVTMASHGRSGIARAIMGSVTDQVLREGGRPMLVIRAKEAGS
jgi:nucleotide-binding universal stress UspA family protein